MIPRSLSRWLAPALLAAGGPALALGQALPSAQTASPQTQARTVVQVPILSRAVAPPTAIYAAPQQPRTIVRRAVAPTSTIVLEAPREVAPRQYRAVPGKPLCGHRLWSRLATLTAARPRLVEVAEEPGPALGLVIESAEVLALEQPSTQVIEVPAAPEAPIFAEPEARGLEPPPKSPPVPTPRAVAPTKRVPRKARPAPAAEPEPEEDEGDDAPPPPELGYRARHEVRSSWEPEGGRD